MPARPPRAAALAGPEARYYRNPRKEAPYHSRNVANQKFLSLVLNPTLQRGLLEEVAELAQPHKDCCDISRPLPSSRGSAEQEPDTEGIAPADAGRHSATG